LQVHLFHLRTFIYWVHSGQFTAQLAHIRVPPPIAHGTPLQRISVANTNSSGRFSICRVWSGRRRRCTDRRHRSLLRFSCVTLYQGLRQNSGVWAPHPPSTSFRCSALQSKTEVGSFDPGSHSRAGTAGFIASQCMPECSGARRQEGGRTSFTAIGERSGHRRWHVGPETAPHLGPWRGRAGCHSWTTLGHHGGRALFFYIH
jgi:hypothetical protein